MGMSTRAIAPTVGVTRPTVIADQRSGGKSLTTSSDLERIDPRTGEVIPPPRPEPLLITDSPEAQQTSSPRPRPHQRQPRTGSSVPGWAGLSRHGTPRATLGAGRTRSRAKRWTRPRAGYGRLRACFLASRAGCWAGDPQRTSRGRHPPSRVEAGQALATIREARLYRETHATFEDYCRERWGWTDAQSNRLILASGVTHQLVSLGAPTPANEAQAYVSNWRHPAAPLASPRARGNPSASSRVSHARSRPSGVSTSVATTEGPTIVRPCRCVPYR